jgi:hypothetical protein
MNPMNTPSIPPLRDFPAESFMRRRELLLIEITRQPRLGLGRHAGFPPLRVALGSAVLAVAAAGAAAVAAVMLTAGGGRATSPLLVQAIRAPEWRSLHPFWGASGVSETCTTLMETVLGCEGVVPTESARTEQIAGRTSHQAANAAIVGGSAKQRRVLRAIVDELGPTSIVRIVLASSGTHVKLQMKATDDSPRTIWMESLAAAAFRDRSRASGAAVTVSLENGLADGGPIPPGPRVILRSAKPGTEAVVRNRFEAAARNAHVTLSNLRLYKPDGVAIAVTLETDDPGRFLLHNMRAFLRALGDRWRYDGTYIRLVDSTKKTVWETTTVGRTLSGSVGVISTLGGCSPLGDWTSISEACAAK